MITELLSQALALPADGIHAASQSAAEKLTGAIDLSKYRQILFLVDSGTLGASGTLDFQVKGSNASGGTYTAIAGTAITQLVKATDDNKYVLVCVRVDQVQALALGYKFIKGSLLPGTAAAISSVAVFGALGSYEPMSGSNATTVAQIVVL